MSGAPIIFVWTDDGHMVPLPHFARRCDQQFVIGERYRLIDAEERSVATHNHMFATLEDKWASLPDHLMAQFPTAEILRKHALIMRGFRRERKFAMATPADARWLAAQLRPQVIDEDDYVIISVNENVVVEWKAMSQSRKAMPEKGQFQRSKVAVLDFADELLGVRPDNAEKAA